MGIIDKAKNFLSSNKKSLKFIALIAFISIGTKYAVRKTDPLNTSVENYLKTHLPTVKGYQPVKTVQLKKSESDLPKSKTIAIKTKAGEKTGYTGIKSILHTFRMNDTLYNVKLYADKRDTVLTMEKPHKATW